MSMRKNTAQTSPLEAPKTAAPQLTPLVERLPATVPFVGPEAQERARGRPFQARLGANENLFGPSPHAKAAWAKAGDDIWMYGDPESHDLRHALAAHHGVRPDNIVVGEGIDGLLGTLVRLYVSEGTPVVTSLGAYPTFNYHVAGAGGALHKQPYLQDHEDLVGLMARARDVSARLVYVANPDNPMGSWHPGEAVARALATLPEGALLVLDEAYVETAPEGTALAVDADDPRVIRMRTFSKAYGLAGARIGYAIGAPAVIAAFERLRNHFGVNRGAQAAALAALEDQSWLAQTCAAIEAAKTRIGEIAATNGLRALPSATNFVAIDCGRDGPFAQAVLKALVARDVFVRMPFVAPQDRCIRISCGQALDLDLVAEALPLALKDARETL